MKCFIWLLMFVLVLAHQDFWYWSDKRLVFGVFPVGLYYHICLTLAASFLWYLVAVCAWPHDLGETDSPQAAPGEANDSHEQRGSQA